MTDTTTKSDLHRAFAEDGKRKTHVGGQALIEGIMMRGKFNWSVAVRTPEGSVYTEEHDLSSGKQKNKWMYWPLVRGCRALVESLMLGYKALEVSATHAFTEGSGTQSEPDDVASRSEVRSGHPVEPILSTGASLAESNSQSEPDDAASRCEEFVQATEADNHKFSWKDDFGNPQEAIDAMGAQNKLEPVMDPNAPLEKTPKAKKEKKKKAADEEDVEFGKTEMAISMVLGLVLGVVLFIVAPAVITNFIVGEYDSNTFLWNIVDGLLRVAVFVFYLWLVGRMKDIKRMFGYHGAEHKTIHCYEHGLDLTPENARSFPRLHVRCGTAFLIMVMIIAILVYTITPINGLIDLWGVPAGAPKLALVILVRILLMPVIAGISYEITVKWAGSHPENPLVKIILWPGMQMQYLTTNEPDDGQLECAIQAMQLVLDREKAEGLA